MMSGNAVVVKEPLMTHPLLTRAIRPIHDWNEWIDLWQKASTLEEMFGLLHYGLDVPMPHRQTEGYQGRIEFYLAVADGWRDSDLFGIKEDHHWEDYQFGYDKHGNPKRYSPKEIRQLVARKAYEMLCQGFFKKWAERKRDDDEVRVMWNNLIISDVFPALQTFFAPMEKYGRVIIRNLTRTSLFQKEHSHHEQQVAAFLLELSRYVWWLREREIPSWWNEEQKRTLEAENLLVPTRKKEGKLWVIEVLNYLDKLNILWNRAIQLDETDLMKLKEIALRTEMPDRSVLDREPRKAATLDEACYAGSKAAWFLKKYELITREGRRLAEIDEAERAQENARRKIEKLSKKPAEKKGENADLPF